MWAVTNQTRFKAERTFVRDRDGAEVWIVAVRGTFAIQPDGQVIVADDQQDVCLAPKYFGEPARSSLQYDMDLVRTKPGTDVILHAHAYPPGGRAAQSVDVSMSVGSVRKTLRVFGNRAWTGTRSGLAPSEPEIFSRLPIRYEHAWGGALPGGDGCHAFNPVGLGAIAVSGAPVPSIETIDDPILSPNHIGTPAGFGPIPFEWQPRLRFAGTYDERWQKDRQPLVPDDFQDAYFRCAPTDQQVDGFLKGGEEVVLRNLTPEGTLRFILPQIALGFRTRIDGGTTLHRGQLYTVIVEPEDRRLIMVWQTSLPCHHTLYTLKETLVIEKKRIPLGGEEEPQVKRGVILCAPRI